MSHSELCPVWFPSALMSKFHIGGKDMNKTQICLCQEGLLRILIAHMGLRTSFAIKAACFSRDSSNQCLFGSFLFMSSPGTACAASSSAIRAELPPRSTFLGAGMETREVLLLCCSQPPLGAARHCPEQDPLLKPCPWHGWAGWWIREPLSSLFPWNLCYKNQPQLA